MIPISSKTPPLTGRAVLAQSWERIVFVHWRVSAAEVAPLLPEGIVPDEFDGTSWVGLIPFVMGRTAVLGSPPIPYFGAFTEVNVRLYGVDAAGRRGVVFRSLEASRLAAVLGARAVFGIPYFWAKATVSEKNGILRYESSRRALTTPSSRVVVRPGSTPVTNDPLADFLTARFLLFGVLLGRTVAMPNEHRPWALYDAELLELDDELVKAAGIHSIAGRAPESVLYSPGVITRFGLPERVR